MMSSSEDDDLDAFLASLRPKNKEEKYRLSVGSLDGFVVGDDHVSFDEHSSSSEDSKESRSRQKDPSIDVLENSLLDLKVEKSMDDSSASGNQNRGSDGTSLQNLSLDDGEDGSHVITHQGILNGDPERGFFNHDKFKSDYESLGNASKKASRKAANARDILKTDRVEHDGSLFAQSGKREKKDQKKQKLKQNTILDLPARNKASYHQEILNGNLEQGFLNHDKFKSDYESLGSASKKVSIKAANARDILKTVPLQHSGSLFAQSGKREEKDQRKRKPKRNGTILDLPAQKKTPYKTASERSESKRLQELRQRGSFTPKRSTANKSTSKSLCITPKIIFSSDSDSGDENVFEKLDTKVMDAPAVRQLPKPSLGWLKPATSSLKKPKKSAEPIILSDNDEEEILPSPVAYPTLTSIETVKVRPDFAEPSLDKESLTASASGSSLSRYKTPKRNSRLFILSDNDDDDEEEILPFVAYPVLASIETAKVKPDFAEPSLDEKTATVSDSGSSLSMYKTPKSNSRILILSDDDEEEAILPSPVAYPSLTSIGPIKVRPDFGEPSLNKKISRILVLSDDDEGPPPDLVTDKLSLDPKEPSMARATIPSLHSTAGSFQRRLSTESDSDSFLNSGKKAAATSLSSAKKSSRILVLSDDSSDDSDPDNDVIFIEDDYEDDKENLERNILESPDESSSESCPRDAHIFGDVFKTPKDVPKKKPKTYRKLLDEDDEEYVPLVSRILGGRRALEESSSNNTLPPQRRISEPKVSGRFTTPIRKPPKFCQTEKVKPKHKPQPRSNGIPPGLPLNCEQGAGFKRNRELLTKRLYDYFNETIFSSRLPKEMIVEWDKRLTKTAGVTKCSRRTVTTTKNGSRCVSRAFMARISLSEKVLDTLQRLRDTLCHEMCHAAVWLIDNQNDGHGPYWKAWARKATAAHPEMPVVKRCHSYDITYKYHYQCTTCRKIYGRHSKSIKVDKQACGVCKGRLVLLPQQNASGVPTKTRQPNKFALFVKENYKATQKSKSVGGMTPKHADVMKGLGEQFASLSTKK